MSMTIAIVTIWGLSALTMVFAWWLCRRVNNIGYVDVFWAGLMAAAALLAGALGMGADLSRSLVALFGGVWGTRLCLHLLRRVLHESEDGRYQALRAAWGDSAWRFFLFFQMQAAVVALFAVPFVAAAGNPSLYGRYAADESEQLAISRRGDEHELIERVAMEARSSEYVDPKSGVSARLTISALESAISAAERRALRCGDERTVVRIADLFAVSPAINGKIELVYEGEQEGPEKVAQHLLSLAIRNVFLGLFPDPEKARKQSRPDAKGRSVPDPYADIIAYFDDQALDLLNDASDALYRSSLEAVPGLYELTRSKHSYLDASEIPVWMEFVLHGLAEKSRIGRSTLADTTRFSDMMGSVFSGDDDDDADEGR